MSRARSESGSSFAVTNIPVPKPVRLKVHASGVCAGENGARLGLHGESSHLLDNPSTTHGPH